MFMDGSSAIPPLVSADEFEREVGPKLVEPFKSKFGAVFFENIDQTGEEHEWLIDGLLSKGEMSIVGGASQSGKSFLVTEAGLRIATGTPFFGFGVSQGLVIYQMGEGSRGGPGRVRAWRNHNGIASNTRLPFVMLRSSVDLYRADGDIEPLIKEIKQIEAIFSDYQLAMIAIDTFANAALGADENSAKDIGLVMANIKLINTETKAHVCNVHHMNAGADKLRGSTAIFARIDQSLFVRRDIKTDVRTVSLGKQRDDDDTLTFQFELKKIKIGWDTRRKMDKTSCVCLPVGEKEAIRRSEEQKGFVLRDDEREFMRVFFEVERQVGLAVPPDMKVSSSVRSIVRIADFRDELERQTPPLDIPAKDAPSDEKAKAKEKHADRIKKHVKRFGEKLKGFGVIGNGQHNDTWFMWWTGKPLRAFPQSQPVIAPEPSEAPVDDAPDF